MPEILTRILCQATTPGEYTRTEEYYTGDLLTPFRQESAATFSCTVFELPVGAELSRFCGPAADPDDTGGALYIIRYAGGGTYSIDDPVNNSPDCPLSQTGDLLLIEDVEVTLLQTSGQPNRWRLQASASSSAFPLTFTLSGQDPVVITAPPGNGNPFGTASFVVPAGRYVISVFDSADGNGNFNEVTVGMETPEAGAPETDLRSFVYPFQETDPQTGAVVREGFERVGDAYDRATRTAVPFRYGTSGPEGQAYSRDTNEEIDRYLLADNRTLRRVFHDGSGGLRFEDTVPAEEVLTGDLELLNLIKTDIDQSGTATGRVWLEADSPAPPISYTLGTQTNATGQFSGLTAGAHEAVLTDAAGRTLRAPFTIEDRYRVRWQLLTDDLDSEALNVYILERDYTGDPVRICGAGSPVQRGWDGIGTDPLAPFAEVSGGTVTLTLRTSEPRQFAALSLSDDRMHRVDVTRASTDALVFRGYVAPETYREPLLSGGQEVTVLAADGLGGLSDREFLNHRARQMRGRRPILSTILHCLSRTDTNLPVYVAANLRETGMSATGEPLLEAWSQRTAYGTDEQKPATCREVLEALLRPHFLHLCQREGAWWLEAIPEIDAPTAVRRYTMEGLPALLPAPTAPLPLHIVPSEDATGPRDLYWITAAQMLELTPAAAAVRSAVKLQLEENQLQNGDLQLWTPTLDRPQNWTVSGGLPVARVNADKVRQYWLELRPSTDPAAGLTSSPVRNLAGQDAAPLRLSLTARALGLPSIPGEPVPDKRIVRLSVEILIDGTPEPETIDFEFESGPKMETQETFLPNGLPAGQLRLRLLAPVLVSGPASTTSHPVRLLVESVKLAIIPAAREWPDEDTFTALNAARGYVLLPTVELAHADIPRLALANGLPAAVSQMNTDAWRHGLSRANRTATETWRRPGQPVADALPLLERAAVERLELRTVPGVGLAGIVRGPAVWRLGVGSMLDSADADGQFMVVSCRHDERLRQATIVVRRLRAGSYTTAPELPDRVRINQLGPRVNQLGYRVV